MYRNCTNARFIGMVVVFNREWILKEEINHRQRVIHLETSFLAALLVNLRVIEIGGLSI